MNEIGFENCECNDDADRLIQEGKIAVGYFFGQTVIHFPIDVYNKLGYEGIFKAVEGIFTKERLEKFRGSKGIVNNRYDIELPPVIKMKRLGEAVEWDPEKKIPKLVQLINEELAKIT